MVFGDADTFAGSIDVVAHELTHGVTSNAADLIYQDQSGAMNESFSDIFGEMVENYVTGSNDWRVGTQISAAIRNMANPHEFHDPAKMSEYVDTTDDHGGVHTNSGIFNYAYYQLVVGLPNAIGPRDAERIYYRALTVHLTKTSQFLDGRLACIQSAEELFGTASPQSQRVAQAFDVAEILPSTPTPPPPTTPPAPRRTRSSSSRTTGRACCRRAGKRRSATPPPASISSTPRRPRSAPRFRATGRWHSS
jgi:Zn-dependent metalloprotease